MAASSMVAELENLRALLDKPATAIAADPAVVAAGPPTTYAGALNTAEVCFCIGGARFAAYPVCYNPLRCDSSALGCGLHTGCLPHEGSNCRAFDAHASNAAALTSSVAACLKRLFMSAQVSVERLSKAMEAAEDEMESAFRRTGAHFSLLQHVCGPVEKCCTVQCRACCVPGLCCAMQCTCRLHCW